MKLQSRTTDKANTAMQATTAHIDSASPYTVIFPLLRAGIWSEESFPFTAAPDTDWEAVYKELCIQTVQNIPVDILIRKNPAMKQQYFQTAAKAVSHWYHLMQEQQALYNLFRSADIPFVVLKGAAADYYYPQPTYRCMGDIDLIVKPADFDRAYELMQDSGYQVIDTPNLRHKELCKNGIQYELHQYFSIFNNPDYIKYLDDRIFSAIDQAQEASIEGLSFPMLPKLENGLVLLQHINQHLESGLGLRQIIDWMLFVDRELDDEWWNLEFRQCVAQIGMETLAVTVTRMCQIYLGLSTDITWCMDAEADLCEELMEYIMEQGNFGRKLSRYTNSVINTVIAAQSIPVLFRRLQQYGCNNWQALKQYPFLKPFAWIYQICRYIRLALGRKHPFRQLKQDVSKSERRSIILKRLGVTQRSKGVMTPKGMRY